MKHRLILFTLLLHLAPLQAEDKGGYRVMVQKTTLERDDTRGNGYYDDRIDRTLGLKVAITNVSMKEKAEATVDYTIIVSRWSYSPNRYEKYTGTEKLSALKQQKSAELTLGKARIGGYANYANQKYQDKVEGWQIIINEPGMPPVSLQSGSSFKHMAEKSVKPTE